VRRFADRRAGPAIGAVVVVLVIGLVLVFITTAVTAFNSDQAPSAGSTGSATQAAAKEAALSKYRFERPPAVVFASANPHPETNINFYVFVRMNRSLPRDAHGIKATFLLNRSSPYGTPITNSRRPPCYSAEIGAGDNPQVAPELVDPHDGQMVTVTLRFPGMDTAKVTVAARAVAPRAVGSDQTNAKYLRRLGCHVSTG
jgi:hypothetical protein